ncbi:hypothetical protein MRX96_041156 [Rhipicephalus microplus]
MLTWGDEYSARPRQDLCIAGAAASTFKNTTATSVYSLARFSARPGQDHCMARAPAATFKNRTAFPTYSLARFSTTPRQDHCIARAAASTFKNMTATLMYSLARLSHAKHNTAFVLQESFTVHSCDQNFGGSEWDTVKAGVAECFRDWGKRRAREERAGIKAVSEAILLLSKPLSGGPGVTAALTSLRKDNRVLLQRRWDRLRATARAEQWEIEAWYSRIVLRRHIARKSSAITSLVDPNTSSLVETQDELLGVARQFYKNLYAEPPPTPYSFPFTKTYEGFDIWDTPLVEGGGVSSP